MTDSMLPPEYIYYDEKKKQPMLIGTHYTVAFLATFIDHPDWTVERLVASYPMTQEQIYAAWAYYSKYKAEIDAILEYEAKRDEQAAIALHDVAKYVEAIAKNEKLKKASED